MVFVYFTVCEISVCGDIIMKINQGNLVKLMVVAALALGALSCGAMAQSVTWTGTGAGVGWSDSNNWLTSGTTPNEGDQLVFGGVVGLSSSNDVSDNFTYSSITFNSGAGAFTLTGSSVGLAGGITNNSANAQTLSFSNYLLSSTQGGIYLKASQTWNAASGDLVITANVSSFNIDGSTPTTLLTVTGGSNTTISGFLNEDTGGGASVLSVLKTGAGRLTLSGNNTYSGGTTLNQGILNLGSVGALGTLGTITFSGGTLQYSVSNNIDYSSRFSQASNQQYNVDTNGRDVTWASNLLSSGGSFSKVGLGTLTITGSIGVDAGDNIVDGGTLDIETTGTFTAPNGTFYVGKSGTAALILNGGNLTTGWTSLGENTASYGSVTVNSGTWSSGLFLVGTSGTGSLTINGGLVTANGFTCIGEYAGATGSVTVNSGTFNLPSSPFVLGDYGTGSLIINGGYVNLGDAVYLGINSNSTGSLTVTSGTLQNSGGVFYVGFSGTGSLNISGGTVNNSYVSIGEAPNSYGAATVTGAVWTIANDLTIGQSGTGTLSLSGSGVLNIVGNVYLAVDPGSVGTLNFGDFTTGTFNAPVVNGGNGTATVNFNNTTNYTFTPQLTGTLSVNLLGSGTTTLTGNNTYSGPTNLASGQLNINSPTAIGSGALAIHNTTSFDNTSGALITLANNNALNWYGLITFVGTNALNLGNGNVTLGTNTEVKVSGSDLTVGGAIDGSGLSLTKSGTGSLFLTGTSTYSGATTVNGGNLVVSGSLTATTGVTVASGATLQLVNGLVNTTGLVSVADNGTLSITGGQSSVGSVALNDGAVFQTTITNSSHAVLNTIGGVTINSSVEGVTLSINSNGYTPNYTQGNLSASDKFVLILGNGTPVAGNFANAISLFDPNYSQTLNEYTDGNGNVWAVFYNVIGTTNLTPGTGNDVSVVLIPEPSTWAMLLGGFGLLGFVQRLRRRSA